MKVGQLIEKLRRCDPELPVVLSFPHEYRFYEVDSVSRFPLQADSGEEMMVVSLARGSPESQELFKFQEATGI